MADATPDLPPDPRPGDPAALTVDCDGCVARGPACSDCVVTVLLGPPRRRLELDADEVSALDALAGAGLVPPLRLVRPDPGSGCCGTSLPGPDGGC
ncbi:hypothetical protein BH20ACT6_BH20ACT6_10650 [soil metagenome]